MHIEELTRKASLDFLAGSRLGRLACANQDRPMLRPAILPIMINGSIVFPLPAKKSNGCARIRLLALKWTK